MLSLALRDAPFLPIRLFQFLYNRVFNLVIRSMSGARTRRRAEARCIICSQDGDVAMKDCFSALTCHKPR